MVPLGVGFTEVCLDKNQRRKTREGKINTLSLCPVVVINSEKISASGIAKNDQAQLFGLISVLCDGVGVPIEVRSV